MSRPSTTRSSFTVSRRSCNRPSVLEIATTSNGKAATACADSDNEDDTPLVKLGVTNRSTRVPSKMKPRSSMESSLDEGEDDHLPAFSPPGVTKNRRGLSARMPSVKARLRRSVATDDNKETDSDDSDNVPIISKKKELLKKVTNKIDLNSEDDSELEILPKRKARPKKPMDSDEEYLLENDDDEEAESTNASSKEDCSEVTFVGDVDADSDGDRNVTVGIVEEGDVGDRDDDDDDDSKSIPVLKPSPPIHDIQPRRHRLSAMDDSDDSSNSSVAQCIRCDSTKDVVTDEDLPEIHVCFFPPDNQNKQCFSLNTLRKIALAQPMQQSLVSTNGTIQRAKPQFLQPPHFRTIMSDDLLDQIASRFGRDALDIHGDYYRRSKALPHPSTGTWPEDRPGSSVLLAQSESIIHQLERYIRSRMGNQDVYCCPVCYVASHQRLIVDESNDDDSEGLDDKEYITDFFYDPMTVLRDARDFIDPFRVASTFCFKRLSQVKDHLRDVHTVSTKMVQGNEVYERYKIRSQDGLLQRYLNQNSGKLAATRQGEMLKYWYYGNNSDFVLLLSLISHAALCRKIVKDSDKTSSDDRGAFEAAEEYLRPSWTFYDSISNQDRLIWNTVASPFLKVSQDEIRDFIASEDYTSEVEEVEDAEPILSHRALLVQSELADFRRAQDAGRKLAAHYDQLVRNLPSADSVSEDEADFTSSDTDEEVQYINNDPQVMSSGSEEAEDEWQKTIMNKRVDKAKAITPHERSGRRVSLSTSKVSPQKRPMERRSDSDDETSWQPTSTPIVHKRLAIRDSDDEP